MFKLQSCRCYENTSKSLSLGDGFYDIPTLVIPKSRSVHQVN